MTLGSIVLAVPSCEFTFPFSSSGRRLIARGLSFLNCGVSMIFSQLICRNRLGWPGRPWNFIGECRKVKEETGTSFSFMSLLSSIRHRPWFRDGMISSFAFIYWRMGSWGSSSTAGRLCSWSWSESWSVEVPHWLIKVQWVFTSLSVLTCQLVFHIVLTFLRLFYWVWSPWEAVWG